VVIVQFIGRFNRGGTASWLINLVPALRELGHDVYLIAGSTPSDEKEDPYFKRLNGTHININGRKINPIKDLVEIWRFRRWLKEIAPDVLNTHTAKAGIIGRIASIGLSIRVCHTYHGHVLTGYFSAPIIKIYILLERFLSIKTDSFIAVGERVQEELVMAGIGSHSKYTVISPFVPNLEFMGRLQSKQLYRLVSNQFVVGWLGRLTPIKRPEIVLKLSRDLPDINFLVGGDGELASLFSKNLPKNLAYVGWQNPRDFWPACNIALLTSDNEGVPTSLIEAAMCGLPLIANNVGSVNEVLVDMQNGFLIDNYQAAKEAISLLRDDESLRITMGKKSKELSLLKFSKNQFIQQHLKAYGIL
jgi:glycosyltransferase involved in cell wall biosynthesis